ncbi:hypothetical protein PVAP13_2KG163196 [Panicum virgatum]|uniref:Reverse transcriptase zinc-binding domain-containing protein n=1 Tax=Panicum virgatum TaxID=38727 RepID=A0A8T0W5G5_PANVG|nr:hypothetical protein PVAP13_2KG163196 [Panicum virgatum]
MLSISVVTSIGNGKNTLFWSDRWIHGCRLEDLAPNVVKSVPIRVRNKRTVAEALHELTWVTDIRVALGWQGLAEYLELWDTLAGITLNTNDDAHIWRFESSGTFPPSRLTGHSSSVLLPSSLGKGYGNLGHRANAKSLYGWLSETTAGQQIGYKKEDYLTLTTAHFAIRRMKQSSTSSLHACSLDNSGFTFCSPWV